jgi:hypothetical protein
MAAGPRGFISRFAVLPASQFHLVAVGEVEVPRVCGVRPLRADEKPEHGAVHGAQQRRRHDAPGRGTAGWCYMAAQGTIMQAECGRLAAGPMHGHRTSVSSLRAWMIVSFLGLSIVQQPTARPGCERER